MSESPKLFLTPSEVHSSSNVVRMAFDKFDVPDIQEGSFNIFYLIYERVNLKNSVYPYVYVLEGSMDLFNSIYLDQK